MQQTNQSKNIQTYPRFPKGINISAGPAYEAGAIHVQFKEGLMPTIVLDPAINTYVIHLAHLGAMTAINQLLQQHGLKVAESTFRTTPKEAADAQANARTSGINAPNLTSFVTLYFPATANIPKIVDALNAMPQVERAARVPKIIPGSLIAPKRHDVTKPAESRPDPLSEPLAGSSDQIVIDPSSSLENQWYLFRCNANRAFELSVGANVILVPIDAGFRTSHQDLVSKIEKTYNAFDDGTDVTNGTYVYHGTAVASLAGAAVNGLGMTGFAPEAAIWAVQWDNGTGEPGEIGTPVIADSISRAIDWVRTTADPHNRRKVCHLSIQTESKGNLEQDTAVNAAILTAIGNGVVVCLSAGNGNRDVGTDDSGNPIPSTGCILVGATVFNATENPRGPFSNFGERVTVAAPGDPSNTVVASSSSDIAYTNLFGKTSAATPMVAGTVALMLSINPNLTHEQIRSILRDTGGPVATDPGKPAGTFLNALAAVQKAEEIKGEQQHPGGQAA